MNIKIKDLSLRVGCILFYFVTTELLNKPIGKLLMKIMGIDESSPQDRIDKLDVIYQIVMYTILIVFILILMFPEIKEGWKSFKEKSVSKGFSEIGLGFLICYGASILGNIIVQAINNGASNSANEQSIDGILGTKYGFLMIVVVCMIGPIVEELVFRGAFQKGLEKVKLPGWLCIIISGTLFGFLHVMEAKDYSFIFPYIFMGYALGFIYYKSKSIITVMIIHIVLNTISTSISLLYNILEELGFYDAEKIQEGFLMICKLIMK